jgi:hypothetical protein
MISINYGCGEKKLPGFVNIDIEVSTNPDVVCDLRNSNFPFDNKSVEKLYCIHAIEHIEDFHWPHIFTEFNRVLVDEGTLVLMYPEFEVCVNYYLENKHGLKDFWKATLYGRQSYPGDYHVTPVQSAYLSTHLFRSGFKNIKWGPDDGAPYYSVMIAQKGKVITKEDLLRTEVFGIKEK